MTREVFLETGVGMALDDAAAVWSFDLDLWGRCVQARSGDGAISTFIVAFGPAQLVETVHGNEQAFARDLQPLLDDELDATLAILTEQRERAILLLTSLPDKVLDHDDPARELPSYARWRTIRQMLWHIADTESRYYLPSLGLPAKPRAIDLLTELGDSTHHVRSTITMMPRDAVIRDRGEMWTATKVARRLAWHERGELDAIDDLLAHWGYHTHRPRPGV